jgi:hypothetical protein
VGRPAPHTAERHPQKKKKKKKLVRREAGADCSTGGTAPEHAPDTPITPIRFLDEKETEKSRQRDGGRGSILSASGIGQGREKVTALSPRLKTPSRRAQTSSRCIKTSSRPRDDRIGPPTRTTTKQKTGGHQKHDLDAGPNTTMGDGVETAGRNRGGKEPRRNGETENDEKSE